MLVGVEPGFVDHPAQKSVYFQHGLVKLLPLATPGTATAQRASAACSLNRHLMAQNQHSLCRATITGESSPAILCKSLILGWLLDFDLPFAPHKNIVL
jgi:hypothetical protein